jgi:predicted O-linked N-acetylglucosamine transferase (SPINDLY family)
MMRLITGVLENHDRQQFEIFAYSIDTKRDEATTYVENVVDHFIELTPSRNEIANRVRQDGIDILVDLAGHTMLVDALLAFALRPAPVQVTWLGMASTGLSCMDYFLGDAYMPCPGTDHLFTEQVYRLPRVNGCYRPSCEVETTIPPFFRNGHITFGSFNDPKKIGREVIKVWSVILHLHPSSKLFLKYGNLGHEMVQRRLRGWFQEDGISADRLRFEGAGTSLQFLHAINEVDIALDPFPYNGGTTTLETLWMGVPVVSITGRLAVNQAGACLLATVGLPVANTLEQYIVLAALMAKAIPEQPDSRRNLRETLKRSQLMDEVGMTRTLEAAYRDMWRHWCVTP